MSKEVKALIKAAIIRAVRTWAQAALSLITVDAAVGLTDINWLRIASVATVAAIYSLLSSVAGLPEAKPKEDTTDIWHDDDGNPVAFLTVADDAGNCWTATLETPENPEEKEG